MHRQGRAEVVTDAFDADGDVVQRELGGGGHGLVAQVGAETGEADTIDAIVPGGAGRMCRGRGFGAGRRQQVEYVEVTIGAASQVGAATGKGDGANGDAALAQIEVAVLGFDGVERENGLHVLRCAYLQADEPDSELVECEVDVPIGQRGDSVMRRHGGHAFGRRHFRRQFDEGRQLGQRDVIDTQAASDGKRIEGQFALPLDLGAKAGACRYLILALVVGQAGQLGQFDVERFDARGHAG